MNVTTIDPFQGAEMTIVVPSLSESGSWLAAGLYVEPLTEASPTLNIALLLLVLMLPVEITQLPEPPVTQDPLPENPLLQAPLTVTPETRFSFAS